MDLKRVVTILSLLIVLAGCAVPAEPTAFPALGEPVASPTSLKFPYVDLTATVQLAPTRLPTNEIPYPGPSPTARPLGYPGEPGAAFVRRTPEPTATPDPNLLLTPTVTPVPLSRPEVNISYAGEPRPLWIYYWNDAQIWRMDESGMEELVLDIVSTFGEVLPIRFRPHQGPHGPAVAIAPDEQRIAIVLAGANGYEIHIYDVATGLASRLGPGERPVWAPDSQRLVYERGGDLWYSDLVAGTQALIVPFDREDGWVPARLVWLYDSQRLVYTRGYRQSPRPEIWLVEMNRPEDHAIIYELMPGKYWFQVSATTDLLYLTMSESDEASNVSSASVWSLRLGSGELRELFSGNTGWWSMMVTPDDHWIFASGYQPGEIVSQMAPSNLWLVDIANANLYRLTDSEISGFLYSIVGWYPAGQFFVLRESSGDLWGFSTEYKQFLLAEGPELDRYVNYSIPALIGGP